MHGPTCPPALELREALRELTPEQLAALIANSAMLKAEETAHS